MNLVKTESAVAQDIKIYSVDEITAHIKNIIEGDKELRDVWITGEISNFKHHNKIHMYFSLKDEDSIIECAMFQNVNQNLGFIPEDGAQVIIRGSIEIYKPRGRYQIIVKELHLKGKGELYQKFLQLKARLEKEGLFKEEHKKPLPKYPKTIGVITSLEGAVIYDIIKVVRKRYPYVKIVISPSSVQGNEAKYTLAKGIEYLNQLDIDVIIIARGGGSFEELWPFNEEIVARSIYNSKIPVVSAIGHETDYTIADFVADKRAPTPSAAAEMITPNKEEILTLLKNMEKSLCRQIKNILEENMQRLDDTTPELIEAFTNKIEILKKDIRNFNERLNALSPHAVLERGYSIIIKQGETVSSVRNIRLGDIISID